MSSDTLVKEREAKNQLAESYRTMLEFAAWKDLMAQLESFEKRAIQDEDNIPLSDLGMAIGIIAQSRGIRDTVRRIRQHVDWIMHGPL